MGNIIENVNNEPNNFYGKFSLKLSSTIIFGLFFQVIGYLVLSTAMFSDSSQFNTFIMFIIIICLSVLLNILGIIFGFVALRRNENKEIALLGIMINVISSLFVTLGNEIYYLSIMRVITALVSLIK